MIGQKKPREDRPRPTCDRKGCPRPPEWRIGFKVWAKGYDKSSTPLSAEIGMFLCDPCGRETKPEDLVTDEGWAMIVGACRARRVAEPDRASIEVTLLPILGLEGRA